MFVCLYVLGLAYDVLKKENLKRKKKKKGKKLKRKKATKLKIENYNGDARGHRGDL